MLTDTTGVVEIDVPRDRAATFEPQIVKKRHDQPAAVPTINRPTLQIDADAFSSAWSAFERATHAATFQFDENGAGRIDVLVDEYEGYRLDDLEQ